ncbi:MAG: hypothetical protein U1E73_13715 [Planctomycetota bacterium]
MPKPNPTAAAARRRPLRARRERLGYTFQDLALLERARTHAPTRNEAEASDEGLEFLGDSFLNFAVAEVLFAKEPEVAVLSCDDRSAGALAVVGGIGSWHINEW